MHHYGWKRVLPSHWSLFIQSRADSCNWGWSPYSGFIKFYCQKWYVFPFCFWQDCVKCSAKCFQRWYKNLLLSFSFMQLSNWNSCLKPDQRHQLTRNVGKVCNKKFCYIFFKILFHNHHVTLFFFWLIQTCSLTGGNAESWGEESIKAHLYLYLGLLPANHALIHEWVQKWQWNEIASSMKFKCY